MNHCNPKCCAINRKFIHTFESADKIKQDKVLNINKVTKYIQEKYVYITINIRLLGTSSQHQVLKSRSRHVRLHISM